MRRQINFQHLQTQTIKPQQKHHIFILGEIIIICLYISRKQFQKPSTWLLSPLHFLNHSNHKLGFTHEGAIWLKKAITWASPFATRYLL